jgi:hypothetical protein
VPADGIDGVPAATICPIIEAATQAVGETCCGGSAGPSAAVLGGAIGGAVGGVAVIGLAVAYFGKLCCFKPTAKA